MNRQSVPPDCPRRRMWTAPSVGFAMMAVLFAGAEFRVATADGPGTISKPGDPDAKALAGQVHAEAAAIDKLRRFCWMALIPIVPLRLLSDS